MQRIVHIKAKKPRKMGFITFSSYKDKQGYLRELVDVNGVVQREFTMYNPVVKLNLEEEGHNQIYEFIKDHPLTLQGIVRIEDITLKQQEEAEKAIDAADAVIIAAKMNTKEYRDFAKLAGFGKVSNDEVLKSKVIKMAYDNPAKFMSIHHDDDKDMRTFLHDAIENKIFKFSNGTWKYGNVNMGLTKDSIIVWLKDNIDVYALLKNEMRKEKPIKATNKMKPIKIETSND